VILIADADKIKEYLTKKTGRSTFPNVFIDGKSIGGGTELASMDSEGSLSKLLHKAGLIH
jgi:glutaredoxin